MAKKQFKAESKRLLDLMINSIYTHKEIFIREIISNASDAIDKLCYRSVADESTGLSRSDFYIRVSIDKENRTITVSDNGIGMSAEDMDKNLGVIAKSGSLQFKKELEEAEDSEIDIIGQFGVGFYSSFMVSSKVTVISKPFGSDEANQWVSTGTDGYTITPCEKEDFGTDIIMQIKEDSEEENYSEFLDNYHLNSLIKKYSDYIRYPILMQVEKMRKVEGVDGEQPQYESYYEEETVNSMVPIWQRSRSEVSDEDCMSFYKEKYYDPSDPLKVIRISAEGSVEYKAMLFVPSEAPYNYYTRDYEAGLALYSGGVLIMENCADLLPEHFRFVKGIVDSQDLSLNISRELLQHNRQLKVIASNIEKRIKNELKKMLDEEREKYEKFFKNFGLQIKYGMVSEYGAHKELLSDLLIFYSSKEGKLQSLAEYAASMPEEQKYIYYARGASVGAVEHLPQNEQIKDKGFSILYLTDDVDEFVVGILGEYEGKQFKSVNDKDLGLQSEEEKQELEREAEENKELLDFIKEALGGEVEEVKLSEKLKSYPVCLSAKGEVTLDMEKYFSTIPGDEQKIKAQRVLELNPEHSAFAALQAAYGNDEERAKKLSKILYNQALLIASMPIDDPSEYAQLVWEVL